MINVEINPTRIILESRQLKSNVTFALVELCFILNHSHLSHGEKCVWIAIACLCNSSEELSCTISYPQIANMVGIKMNEVQVAINRLKHMGFIKINIDALSLIDCSLMLPLEGLLALKKAPKRPEIQQSKTASTLEKHLENDVGYCPVVVQTRAQNNELHEQEEEEVKSMLKSFVELFSRNKNEQWS